MKKYRLIKEYPSSDSLGTIITGSKEAMYSKGLGFRHYDWAHVETHPEYWEEVIEKDYEILEYSTNETLTSKQILTKDMEGWNEIIESTTFKIHSVKRLSDGEVFTVGDRISVSDIGISDTITEIVLADSVKRLSDGEVFTVGDRVRVDEYGSVITIDSMHLVTKGSSMKEGIWLTYNSGSSHIVHAIKQEKQPIFLTHDGKDIFAGDKVWWVNKKTFCSDYFVPTPSVTFFSNINAYFLTKEEAEDYISRNKVLFTTEDGKDIFKGDQVWYVHKGGRNMSINYLIPSLGTTFRSESYAYFLTKEAAEDYVEKNKILFTTEDGVSIKRGDTFYFVDTDLSISLSNALPGCGQYSERKYFSTYETAEYYVIVNAKVLSIEEFWEFVSKPGSNIVKQKQLKRLVKERLNLK